MKIIHLKKIDLNLLVIFDQIYKKENISLAAEELGRTQSAVSHSLEKLRYTFRDPLFVRTSKRMKPTSKAEELAPQIQAILESTLQIFQTSENFSPSELERSFSISMSDYCQWVLLPNLTRYFSTNAPRISLRILSPASQDPQTGLESGLFDLVIGNRDIGMSVFQQRLFEDEFVCMIEKNHRKITKKLTIDQYLTHKHLIFSPRGQEDRLIDEYLKKQGIKRQIAMQIPNIMIIPQLLPETPYIVTIPRKITKFVDTESLVIMNPPIQLPKIPVMQYWHEAMHRDPIHRWLRETIFELANPQKLD